MSTATIRRRLVFVFPGFEPLTAEANARRFLYRLGRSAPLYDLSVQASEPITADVGSGLRASSFDVQMGSAPTQTTVVLYGLGAINEAYGARSSAVRIARGCFALLDFLLTGTFWRYLRTSWRYALFFLFPVLVVCAIAALGALAFVLFARWGLAPAVVAACALFVGLMLLADRQFHLRLLMDDWSFARDLARGHDAWVNGLLAAVNADVSQRIAAFNGDEVVFAGHSLGVVPLVGALAETIRRHEATARPSIVALGLLSVGSSLLKIALHPAAKGLRRDVAEVASSACPWLDVQSVSDPISFYHSNPVQSLKLGPAERVRVMRISLRKQLSPQSVRESRFNLFKLHRQFVRAVEKRSAFSFHVILCGPVPFASLVSGQTAGLRAGRSNPNG